MMERRNSIGSSEIACLLGADPYRTPYQLWAEKTGQAPPFTGNKYTVAGTRLEPVVVEYFAEATGFEILPGYEKDVRFTHPGYPFCTATPDRFYISGEGRKGIVECKTTQMQVDADMLPVHWFCQAQYQAAIVNAAGGDIAEITIAWLVRGLDFGYATFEVDEDFGTEMINRVFDFWANYIEAGVPPEFETTDDVLMAYPNSDGTDVHAADETVSVYEQLVSIDDRIKRLEDEKKMAVDAIKMAMKGADRLVYYGSVLATWKSSKPVARLDTKRIKDEAPDVYQQFLKPAEPVRTFLLKKKPGAA